MALGLRRLLLAALLLVSCHLALSNARLVGKDELREKQKAAAERFSFSTLATASSANHKPPRKNITFSNPKAKSEFYCLLWIPRTGSCSWVGQSSSSMELTFLRLTSILGRAGPGCYPSAPLPTRQGRYDWSPFERIYHRCLPRSALFLVLPSRT